MAQEPLPEGVAPVRDLLRRWFERRDKEALEELLQRNWEVLLRHAHARMSDRLRSKHDTVDIMHDALIEFMQYSPRFEVEDEAHLRALLFRIVDNVMNGQHRWFARMRRDIARERPLPDGTTVFMQPLANGGLSPASQVAAHEREAAVRLAIMCLDPTDQKIVMLRIYRDLPFAEIGIETDMKEDSVRVRFGRAVKKLEHKVAALCKGHVEDFLA